MMCLPACEQSIVALYRTYHPSVVRVFTSATTYGTGFVWDDHHVITCAHVLDPTVTTSTIALSTGESRKVCTTRVDHLHDIALLHCGTLLPLPLRCCRPGAVQPGIRAFAIYAEIDAPPAIAGGIVGGVNRRACGVEGGDDLMGLMQVDVAVNKGASGAPLLRSDGSLIGMVCAIRSQGGRFEGVAYAVPVDVLLDVCGETIKARL